MRRLRAGALATLSLCVMACSVLPSPESERWVVVIDDPMSGDGMSGEMYSREMNSEHSVDVHQIAMDIAATYDVELLADWPINQVGVYCIEIRGADSQTLQKLRIDPRVLWIQNEHGLRVESSAMAPTPNDLLNDFMATVTERGGDTVIAVIDTDVDTSHPDLLDAKLTVSDFVGQQGMPMKERHGTAVVGLISSKPRSEKGMRGIADEAQTHLLRACWEKDRGKGICSTRTLSKALNAAIELRPDIVNLSLSGVRDPLLDRLVGILIRNGSLVIAAYDEDRSPERRFPAARPGVIYAVGSVQPMAANDTMTVVIAPRSAISTAPMASYDVVTGHSIAAPIVAAMAACLMHRYPDATHDEIIAHLLNWSDRMLEQQATTRR
ncbi:MAG: S8 family serine peptidase [Pseudomonadota bacterium]